MENSKTRNPFLGFYVNSLTVDLFKEASFQLQLVSFNGFFPPPFFCFGFTRKPKHLRRPAGFNNRLSQELLLDDDIEDEDDCSYNGEVTSTGNGDESESQSRTKRSEEILHYRVQNGMICRQFPVKETHKVVRTEDENGNKMVNEYVRECKIGSGSYGKVVLYRSLSDGKHYAIKAFHKSHLLKLRVAPSETAMTDVLRENIVHGDIKPDNLLVTLNGTVKIGDFSVSQVFEDDNDELRRSPGTPVFTAPECCLGLTYRGKAADTWAVGVTLYCMVLGRYPFLGETLQDTYDKIVNNPLILPDGMNPMLKNLLEGLLCKEPGQRMTLNAIAEHSWVIGDDGPIPQYLCWCKRKSLAEESHGSKDNINIIHTD
ncbi:serine/threonine-protein kinase GRIK2 isoform X4 [Ziziphus jujuba]|uniref:Serine/threonine-protein kinase GRIK2 isoform X4 n=1 Tax=Ziziphus jujuba TaxID=326968 RepID=A0ABM3IAH1_ZIZJJ|nr:serine/threonine-protein kinase GRIK2 isoform X4 [Ziziphus jujuba]